MGWVEAGQQGGETDRTLQSTGQGVLDEKRRHEIQALPSR